MNQAIADIIKGHIEDLDFVDKIAGLVSTVYMDVADKDGNLQQKAFPVACCVTADDCKAGAYNDLMPNSQYDTVIYFEDGGVTFNKYEGNHKYYTSTLRLVCWINVAKILADTCKTGTACTLSAHLITEIIRALPEFPEDHTPFHRIYSEVTGQEIRSNGIFSQYTYDEKAVQFLMYPFDYFALSITTQFSICMESDVVPAPCDDVIEQMTPVAESADGIGCTSFTANWVEETEATGYKLDVSTVSTFVSFVAGYQDLDVGLTTNYNVTGLVTATTYYYRVRAYDAIDESTNSNIITVNTLYCDWFLPSAAMLTAIRDNLTPLALGNFSTGFYWASNEYNATQANSLLLIGGGSATLLKSATTGPTVLPMRVRACRSFTASVGDYIIGDTGPAGGIIFYVDTTTYYEVETSDQASGVAWSNITNVLIGTTIDSIVESLNNTNEIVTQPGHVNSAAQYCKSHTA